MTAGARVGVIVLTQGRRPDELRRAIASVETQESVSTDIVVVGNEWDPATADPRLPSGVKTLSLPTNVGIPEGRNRGVPLVEGQVLLFLDDDAELGTPRFLADALALLDREPSIGLVQPRVVDPATGETSRQWIPRMRKGEATASSAIFSCWEGASLIRREVFDAADGWAGPFFYAHEGIELVWRVWDAGSKAWYAGDLTAHHPVIQQTRHSQYYRLNARNRVWLARRNLPWLIAPFYVLTWTLVQIARWNRRPKTLAAWFRGWFEGWRTDPGERRPITWRTVARMTAAGRPPIV
jgi:GT2 family glycosyltransferase